MIKLNIPVAQINQLQTIATNTPILFYELLELRFKVDRMKRRGGYYTLEDTNGLIEDNLGFARFMAYYNAANIIVENYQTFIEMPVAAFDNNVISGVPNRTYQDENGDVQTHTWRTWATDDEQYTYLENIAGTKVVFAAKPTGSYILKNSEFGAIATAASGNANITIHNRKSYQQNILGNSEWVAQE